MLPDVESEIREKSRGGREHNAKYTLRKFIHSVIQLISGKHLTQLYYVIILTFNLTAI